MTFACVPVGARARLKLPPSCSNCDQTVFIWRPRFSNEKAWWSSPPSGASKPGFDVPPRPDGDRSRVDLAILVPNGTSIVVEALNGLVETRGVHGDASFHTEIGDIRIHRHFGAVSASTETGSIEAVLMDRPDRQGTDF